MLPPMPTESADDPDLEMAAAEVEWREQQEKKRVKRTPREFGGTAETPSGVPQPAAGESTQTEMRVARNRVAYTREEFVAYFPQGRMHNGNGTMLRRHPATFLSPLPPKPQRSRKRSRSNARPTQGLPKKARPRNHQARRASPTTQAT